MKEIKIGQRIEDPQIWDVNYNGVLKQFSSYEEALSEARFLLHYHAFKVLRGETDDGAMLIRIDEIIKTDPRIGEIRNYVETILEQTDCKDAIQKRMEKWL